MWNWIVQYAKTKDGRGAYLALKRQYLGNSFMSSRVAEADATLETIFYSGSSRNFTFDDFCAKFFKSITILKKFGEPVPESKQVRKFLDAITDPRLQTTIAVVRASPAHGSRLEDAKNFIRQQLVNMNITEKRNRKQQISTTTTDKDAKGRKIKATETGNRKRKGKGEGGKPSKKGKSAFDDKNPGKYYSPKEYSKLTEAQRKQVHEARKRKRSKDENDDLRRRVAALEISSNANRNGNGNAGGSGNDEPNMARPGGTRGSRD